MHAAKVVAAVPEVKLNHIKHGQDSVFNQEGL